MFEKHTRVRRAVAAASAFAGFALFAPSALAVGNTDTVAGTTQSLLSVAVSTPATAFTTGFQPGGTANTTGALLVTDTSSSPTLQVADLTSTSNNGKMQLLNPNGILNPAGCSASESVLGQALGVSVTGTGVTAHSVSLSGANQTVATATAPVAAGVWTTNYSQSIGSGETLLTGCLYNVTATYTLSS